MGHSKALVSIGMPVYNGERFIGQALDSLLAQDYENFELSISDNASTDRTQEICLEYAARDVRIRYCRNEKNMGAIWNFNRVFELSSGEYFMWAAHDDYWDTRYLRSCLEAFDISEGIVLVGTECESIDSVTGELRFIDQGFSTIGLTPRERFMRYKSTVHGGGHIGAIFHGIFKRTALREVMPMRKVIASDHLILAGLCLHGEFVTVQEKLMFKRWGGASTSHRDNARILRIDNQLLIGFPYVVREAMLQKIILQTDKLALPEKIRLACWSSNNYARFCGIRALILTYRMLPAFAKRRARRARELWRIMAPKKSGVGSPTGG